MDRPSPKEWRLVARCLLEEGILIGSYTEIWTDPLPWRVLPTFRECIDAITVLIGGGHGVEPSFVKACVMHSSSDGFVSYFLDEVAEFVVKDPEARAYWETLVTDDRFPHRCPHCPAAAYVGYLQVECKAECRSGS
jgi:hypothetical protein